MKINILKKIIVIVIVSVPILYFTTPLKDYLSQENIKLFIESNGVFAPIIFIIIYIIALLLLLPASLFTILGGVIFGLTEGLIYVVFAATIAATLGFLSSKKLYSDNGKTTNIKFFNYILENIKKYSKTNGFQTVLILRLLYLPYMPLSYGLGLIKEIKLRDFVLATFLTNIIGSFVFVFLGDQIKNGPVALILPISLILLSLLIPKITKKILKK